MTEESYRRSNRLNWFLLALLLADNTLDVVLLRRYTSPVTHETFPLLAWTLKHWGFDASIWSIRAIVYSFALAVRILAHAWPRALPYINEFLVILNLVYAAGMLDYPFAMGWWPTDAPLHTALSDRVLP